MGHDVDEPPPLTWPRLLGLVLGTFMGGLGFWLMWRGGPGSAWEVLGWAPVSGGVALMRAAWRS